MIRPAVEFNSEQLSGGSAHQTRTRRFSLIRILHSILLDRFLFNGTGPMISRTVQLLLVLLSTNIVGVVTAADAVETPSDSFSIMTWNLEWFYDENPSDNRSKLAKEKAAPSRDQWNWRRDSIAAAIAEANPSVCAVQEAESRQVLWYLTKAIERNHSLVYREMCPESKDVFTEQDVGFLYRSPAELVATTLFSPSSADRASGDFYDVSKHVLGVFEIATGTTSDHVNVTERVMVMNVHLRSTADAENIRVRQARLIYHWLAEYIRQGQNVIILGDFNTETKPHSEANRPASIASGLSDMEVASGLEQRELAHRLVDLQTFQTPGKTQTHLLSDRSFDRILVSQSLIDDDPNRRDLVFESVEVRRDLAVQGGVDQPEEHWERYWQMPRDQRDLSDHFPVMAKFKIQ